MTQFCIKNFGPIHKADVTLGDLTVLVGPQATGKSLFLQMFKLAMDHEAIIAQLRQYAFAWKNGQGFLAIYLGEGLQGAWTDSSKMLFEDKPLPLESILSSKLKTDAESYGFHGAVYYIPALRLMTFAYEWPRPFGDYRPTDPYALKAFSEDLRSVLELPPEMSGWTEGPEPSLKPVIDALAWDVIEQAVYQGGRLVQDTEGPKKRLLLRLRDSGRLPILSWSEGQRQFTPLLLGVKSAHDMYFGSGGGANQWLIVEEPELGLHPQAVFAFMLTVLDLIARGQKVIVSTHSPAVLDVVWAMRELQQAEAPLAAFSDLFGLRDDLAGLETLYEGVMIKAFKTYLFEKAADGTEARDISTLDPGDEQDIVSGWGGLSGFAGHAAEVVGKAVNGEYV